MDSHPAKHPHRVALTCACALLIGWASPLLAQAPPESSEIPAIDPQLLDALARRGSLDLEGMPLDDALYVISDMWKVNIVLGSAEKDGFVPAAAFEDTTLQEILDAILFINGYGYRPLGKSLIVKKFEELGDVHPLFEQRVVTLSRQKVDDLIEAVDMMRSPTGKTAAIAGANSILLLDFPDRVALMERFLRDLDSGGDEADGAGLLGAGGVGVNTYHLQYVDATATAEACQNVLSDLGKTQALVAENAIVVVDVPSGLALVRDLIPRLDIPRPQVRITALIYDISLEDIEELGVNWNRAIKLRVQPDGTPRTVLGIASETLIAPGASLPSGAVTFANLSRHFDLNSVLQVLHTANDARLLADPNITVVNNEEASIDIVTEVPYQQLSQTQQGGNIGTTAFREVGVQLKVTPHIADDQTIEMHVMPSFSRLTGFTPGEIAQPIIDRRSADTTIRIADGELLVIGGLRQRSDVGVFNGVPYLKDIKYIGTLFRGHTTTVRESELVVFIMPEIVYPGYCGRPREGAAFSTSQTILDGIPVADGRHPEIHPGPPPHSGHEFLPSSPAGQPNGPTTESGPEFVPLPQDQLPEIHSGAGARTNAAPHVVRRNSDGRLSHHSGPSANHARVAVAQSVLFDEKLPQAEPVSSSSWWKPSPAAPRGEPANRLPPVPAARTADRSGGWLHRWFKR